MSSTLALAIDFGSTYTKVVAVGLGAETLIGVTQAPSTAGTDITLGLHALLARLFESTGVAPSEFALHVASSSAPRGLRMVAIGLVPDLTVEAARRAALGAGAKVIRVFGYTLSRRDLADLQAVKPEVEDALVKAGYGPPSRSSPPWLPHSAHPRA